MEALFKCTLHSRGLHLHDTDIETHRRKDQKLWCHNGQIIAGKAKVLLKTSLFSTRYTVTQENISDWIID